MKTTWLALGASALMTLPAAAETLVVPGLTLTGFSFQVATQGGDASTTITEASAGSVISTTAGGDLAGGQPPSGNPLFSFWLTDPIGRGEGEVTMRTGLVAPATVDTATNSLSLDLSTLTFDWDTGTAPSLCTVKPCIQPQALGPVAGGPGSWNPVTGDFSVSWQYYWSGDLVGEDHPFPFGTSTLSLSGVTAQPIPEPGTLALWLGGLLVGAAWQRVARRRANGEPNRR